MTAQLDEWKRKSRVYKLKRVATSIEEMQLLDAIDAASDELEKLEKRNDQLLGKRSEVIQRLSMASSSQFTQAVCDGSRDFIAVLDSELGLVAESHAKLSDELEQLEKQLLLLSKKKKLYESRREDAVARYWAGLTKKQELELSELRLAKGTEK